MAYHPYDRNPSGIVYFGASASDQVFESNSNFVIDHLNSILRVPNIVTDNGATIGPVGNTDLLTLGTGSLTIDGDLIVNGSQVIINTETLTIDDNIIVLNDNNTGGVDQDAGIEVYRGTAGNSVRLLWDEGEDYWTFTNNGTNYYRIATHATAGSGLVDAGIVNESKVLHVGKGDGISVAADTVSVVEGTGITVDGNGVHVDETVITSRTLMPSGDFVGSQDQFLVYDSGVGLKRITGNDLIAGLGAAIAVFEVENFIDSDRIDFSVVVGESVTADIKTNSISEAYLTSSVAGSGLIGGNNTPLHVNFDNSTLEVSSDILRVKDNGITNAKLRDSSALSVIGRSANSSGDPADIAAASDHQVLRRSGTSLGFGAINLASTDAVTGDLPYSNLAQGSALSVLGVAGNATADVASIASTVDGQVLRRSGTSLGFGTIASAGIADGAVTEAKRFRDVANISTSTTLSADINLVTGGAGGVTVTLPTATEGRKITVKKVDSAAGFVTISGGAKTIDGAANKILYYQYESLTFICGDSGTNGNNWFVI